MKISGRALNHNELPVILCPVIALIPAVAKERGVELPQHWRVGGGTHEPARPGEEIVAYFQTSRHGLKVPIFDTGELRRKEA